MGKKKILIIDDYIPLLEEITEFLSFEGYKAYSAKDGAEGVQMAIVKRPDLILCDIEMPEMNGYEVFRTLEKIPSTASIPFIFLSARAHVDDFKTGLQLGADDYITKPLDLDNLLNSISKRLSKLERLKNFNSDKFNILIKNPLIGTFIYIEDKFALVNKKFEEITGFDKFSINKIKLSDVLLGEKELIISKLASCLNNIRRQELIRLSFLNKDKRAVFVELYAKYIEIEGKNALIGSIVEVNKTDSLKPNSLNKSFNEFEKIVDYLNSIGKSKIADEIINAKELLSFEKESETKKIIKKVKLTKRENEILILICEGLTNKEIAEKLFISNRTVDNHRASLLTKTNTKNSAALVAFAFRNNLIKI